MGCWGMIINMDNKDNPCDIGVKDGKPFVLMIDDDKALVEIYKDKLSANGFRVKGALGGEEGLKIIKEECPNVVILDLRMPGMDGKEVLDEIRGCEETEGTKVVLFTSFHEYGGDEVNSEYAKKIGADAFLEKDVDLDELVKVIRGLV